MPELDAPALYLECRHDRVVALRAIVRRLHAALYATPSGDAHRLDRLRRRIARAHRHLNDLTGGQG